MEISKQRIAYLLMIYSEGKANEAEEQELFNWVAENNEAGFITKHIEQLVHSYNSQEEVPMVNWEQLYERIVEEKNEDNIRQVPRKLTWFRWVAAAVFILLAGTGYYFFIGNSKSPEVAKIVALPEFKDIAPPNSSNAVLTLSNGQKIILDSSGNGVLAMQGNVNVTKLAQGEIVYKGSGNEIEYNTLSNPRGSKVITVVLSDGSRVWLNTASSLRYPTAFVGKERKVEVTGEAYFEVVPNSSMPFIVEKGKTSIQVLGTHFNVNAYEDENSLNVTLLEGSVRIRSAVKDKPVVLEPGEQAQVNKSGNIERSTEIDVSEVMAWKNGEFLFKGAGIENIMREVSRWYDVEIIFDNPIEEKFFAEVSKNTGVSTLLQMLEATKVVHFKIEGKKIRVISGKK